MSDFSEEGFQSLLEDARRSLKAGEVVSAINSFEEARTLRLGRPEFLELSQLYIQLGEVPNAISVGFEMLGASMVMENTRWAIVAKDMKEKIGDRIPSDLLDSSESPDVELPEDHELYAKKEDITPSLLTLFSAVRDPYYNFEMGFLFGVYSFLIQDGWWEFVSKEETEAIERKYPEEDDDGEAAHQAWSELNAERWEKWDNFAEANSNQRGISPENLLRSQFEEIWSALEEPIQGIEIFKDLVESNPEYNLPLGLSAKSLGMFEYAKECFLSIPHSHPFYLRSQLEFFECDPSPDSYWDHLGKCRELALEFPHSSKLRLVLLGLLQKISLKEIDNIPRTEAFEAILEPLKEQIEQTDITLGNGMLDGMEGVAKGRPHIENEDFQRYIARLFQNLGDELKRNLHNEDIQEESSIAGLTVSDIIDKGESDRLEFKETLEYDTKKGERAKYLSEEVVYEIAAFLNATGGCLLIGVSDDGKTKGLERDFVFCKNRNEDGFELKLRDLLKTRLRPNPIGLVQIGFETLDEDIVCKVDIDPSNNIVYVKNAIWVRDGNRKLKLEGRDLVEWLQRKALNESKRRTKDTDSTQG